MKYRLKETIFDRWIIQHPEQDRLGYTGLAWSEIDDAGIAVGRHQVSNFATKEEAVQYAKRHGFEETV